MEALNLSVGLDWKSVDVKMIGNVLFSGIIDTFTFSCIGFKLENDYDMELSLRIKT